MPKLPSILLVEDQKLLRLGLRIMLESLNSCLVVGEADDGEAAITETMRLQPDVVLMDVGLPRMDGIEATWQIKQRLPRTRIIMFTSHTDPAAVSSAFGAGADGYCAKEASVEDIVNAIEAVMKGDVWLDPAIADVVVRSRNSHDVALTDSMSAHELEILALIQNKLSNPEIARRLNTSTESIAKNMHNIISRFVEKKSLTPLTANETANSSKHWLTAFVEDSNEGTIFNEKYLILNRIGTGGVGSVFKAKHLYIDRIVALKLLRPEIAVDRLSLRNFQREATALANLQHKNVVHLHDFGISQNQEAFLVMEYVDGINLADILEREGRLTLRRAIDLCVQICDGLGEAHSKGVIHCDLKPSNIVLLNDAGVETVKLVDFGLVQQAPQETASVASRLTDKYFLCGTPAFMSPEQCESKELDALTDIYSLGCILYEALTGLTAFDGLNPMEIFAKKMTTSVPRLSANSPDGLFLPELENLVATMTSRDRALRPQSMAEVKAILLKIQTGAPTLSL